MERSYEYVDPFDDDFVEMYTDILVKMSDERLTEFGEVSMDGGENSLPEIAEACPTSKISAHDNWRYVEVALRFDNRETARLWMEFRSKTTGEFTYFQTLNSDFPELWQDLRAGFNFNSSTLSELFSTDYPDIQSAVAHVNKNSDSEFGADVVLNFENDVQLNFTIDLILPPLLDGQGGR